MKLLPPVAAVVAVASTLLFGPSAVRGDPTGSNTIRQCISPEGEEDPVVRENEQFMAEVDDMIRALLDRYHQARWCRNEFVIDVADPNQGIRNAVEGCPS